MWRRWLYCRLLSALDRSLDLWCSVSSWGIVCSAGVASSDGDVGSNGPGISCSGGGRIPKCCYICLRMVVCWVCMAISWSWCACMAAICWKRTPWVVLNVCNVWHRPLNSELDMVIEDSDGGGADVVGTTSGASWVVGGAKDVASGMGTVGGVVGAGGMISIGISAYCACYACGGCSSCGSSRGAGISEVPGGTT